MFLRNHRGYRGSFVIAFILLSMATPQKIRQPIQRCERLQTNTFKDRQIGRVVGVEQRMQLVLTLYWIFRPILS